MQILLSLVIPQRLFTSSCFPIPSPSSVSCVHFLQQISLQKFDIRKRQYMLYIIFLYLLYSINDRFSFFIRMCAHFAPFLLPAAYLISNPPSLLSLVTNSLATRSSLRHSTSCEQYPEHLSISLAFLLLPITIISARCQTFP